MTRRIFKSDILEEQISKQGYVKIPFLNEDELVACREIFNSLDPKLNVPFYSSIDSKEIEYRREVDRRLHELLGAKAEELFDNYKTIAHTYIVKIASPDTKIHLHLDDIHLDQSRYRAVNIWLPLVDVTKENGCLRVYDGTQRLPKFHRGFGVDFIYRPYIPILEEGLIDVPVKAGELVVYDDLLIHASWPNLSDSIRPAIVSGLIPEEAELWACFQHKGIREDEVEYFKVDKNFWLTFDKLDRPEKIYPSLGVFKVQKPNYSEQEFRQKLLNLQY